jgi:hypothetical protein
MYWCRPRGKLELARTRLAASPRHGCKLFTAALWCSRTACAFSFSPAAPLLLLLLLLLLLSAAAAAPRAFS